MNHHTMLVLNTLNRITKCPAIWQPARLQASPALVSVVSGSDAIKNKVNFQPADDAGGILNGHGLRGIDNLQTHELNDSEAIKSEHRSHERFRLSRDAYALIRSFSRGPLKIGGKSMGCIACAVFNAKPAKLGMIDDISMGGLAFQHVESRRDSDEAMVLDILLADCGFYLADIPYKIVKDSNISDDIPGESIAMRQVRLQFQNMTAIQQSTLKEFILAHGIENSLI